VGILMEVTVHEIMEFNGVVDVLSGKVVGVR
jgi:hypothetical protein